MRTCSKCNAYVPEAEAKFCPVCGNPLTASGNKSKITLIIASVACLVLIIAFVSWTIIVHSRSAYAAVIAPEGTDMFCVINPDLGQVKNFNRIKDIYMSIPEVKKILDDYQNQLKKNSDIDYENDIKPWLGREIALIIPDVDTINHSKPGVLVAVATKNKKKTDLFLEKLRSKLEREGADFQEKDYQGIKITVQQERSGYTPLVYTYVRNFLLLSDSEDLICQAINKSKDKGQGSLSKNQDYKNVMAQLPKSRLGSMYIDFRDLAGTISRESDLNFDQLRQLQLYKGIVLSLSCEYDGVRLDYVLACDPEKTEIGGTESPGSGSLAGTLNITPGDTIAYFGCADLKTILEDLNRNLKKLLDEENYVEDIEQEIGVDVEDDVFSWMRGEAAFAVLPDSTTFFGISGSNLGMYAMIGVSDPEKARSKMEMIINRIMENSGDFIEKEETINGQEVHLVRDLIEGYEGNEVFGYALRGDYLIISSSLATLRKALDSSGGSLPNSEAFREAIGKKTHSDTCLFVDIRKGLDLFRSSMDESQCQEFDEEVYPFIKPIKSVSFTTEKTKTKDQFVRGGLLINITQ